jgi:hypothetical protein
MKKQNDGQVLFAVLPYIQTSKPAFVRGIWFRSNNDAAGLSVQDQKYLKQIAGMFLVGKNRPVDQITYACFKLTDDKTRTSEIIQQLREAHTLISYLECRTDTRAGQPIRDFEDLALHLFMPRRFPTIILWDSLRDRTAKNDPPIRVRRTVSGFECLLNWNTQVYIDKSYRLYPQSIKILSYGDLYSDIQEYLEQSQNWAIAHLWRATKPKLEEAESRIFTALGWYNLSAEKTIEEDRRLIHLAIAFESLLGLEYGDGFTKRFKETVNILLGSVPRLDDWLTQFYDARSEIVHKGRSASLMFHALPLRKRRDGSRENKDIFAIPYRPLTNYGRMIFRLCLNSILSGATLAGESRLSTLMIHNQERLVDICKKLGQTNRTPEQKIESVRSDVRELGEYWMDSAEHTDMDTLVGAGKRIIDTYLQTDPEVSPEIRELMKAISQSQEKLTTKESLELFEKLSEFNGRWKGTADETIDTGVLQYVVSSFVEYVAKPHQLWDW